MAFELMGALLCPSGHVPAEGSFTPESLHTSSNVWMMTCGGMCANPSVRERDVMLPDFTGEWVCFACDGDMDAFLAEMGAGLLARLSARVRRYDVDKIVRVFKQRGNDLDIDVRGTRKFTQILTVGGGPQVCEDEDGAVLVEPAWERRGKEGYVLCFEMTEQDGSRPRTARHWISGNELTIEYTTRTACCVKWRYRRRGGQGSKPSVMLNPPPPPRAELMRNGKPDFSGTWLSYTWEGDVEGFLRRDGRWKSWTHGDVCNELWSWNDSEGHCAEWTTA